MPIQKSIIKIRGTIGGVCFYRMDKKYYARAKSSLNGKRVKTDPAFTKTMQYATLLGRASGIASLLYRQLPHQKRSTKLFRKLTGTAMQLLKDGMEDDEVLMRLKVGNGEVSNEKRPTGNMK